MARQFASLQRTEHNGKITPDFLFHLQRALLLALQERGRLTADQYRHAEQLLQKRKPEDVL